MLAILPWPQYVNIYCQISNICCTLIGNKIVDHSDVVGSSPVGAAPTTSSFSIYHMASIYCTKLNARQDWKHLSFCIWCIFYYRFDGKITTMATTPGMAYYGAYPDYLINTYKIAPSINHPTADWVLT